MNLILNILWFIFGGFLSGISWLLTGIFWFITIIGIPYAQQCFKFASISFAPFGKDIEYTDSDKPVSIILNIFWLIFGGVPLAITNLSLAVTMFCSIIGIPFGLQYLKIVKLSIMPFGAKIVEKK